METAAIRQLRLDILSQLNPPVAGQAYGGLNEVYQFALAHGRLPRNREAAERSLYWRLWRGKRQPSKSLAVTHLLQEIAAASKRTRTSGLYHLCEVVWERALAHGGQLPQRSRDNPAQTKLADRFRKFRRLVDDESQPVTPREVARLHRVLEEQATFSAHVLHVEKCAAKAYFDFARRRSVARRQLPCLQKRLDPSSGYGGRSPFPWFVNCGNTCYLNAVVHCLFHCEAVRGSLLAAQPTNEVRVEVQELLRAYTQGVQPANQPSPRHWDVLVPHRLLEVVEEYARSLSAVRRFDVGPQHAAAELVS